MARGGKLLAAKKALEVIKSRRVLEEGKHRLVDAQPQPDGSVLVYLDSEESPSFQLEIVVKDLKAPVVEEIKAQSANM